MTKGASLPIRKQGEHIDNGTRQKIIQMLLSGEHPVDAEIARACNVSALTVSNILKKDPELVRLRRNAELEMAQLIERSGFQLAISGRNEIARQKAQEFFLKKLMPEKYGDDAELNRSAQSGKRIVLMPALPVVSVDANGIPISQAKSKSPLEPEAIEAQ